MSLLTIDQTKAQMIALLKEGVCEINFMKKGKKGEPELVPRKMFGTLAEQYLPDIDPTKEARRTNVDGPGLITVFDMEAEGWRRFILDNLTEEVKRRPDLDL
jgi:hypothetical protein